MSRIPPDRPRDILLVEDDAADALLVQEALRARGAARSIAWVPDGLAALEVLRDPAATRPDLIVVDLNMPRMNGRELLAVLKADARLKMIPVVVLSTSDAPADVRAAYERHANAYITKPVNLDDFVDAVRSLDMFFLDTAVLPDGGGSTAGAD
ncbi:response regulator [Streptacidiphilus sp. P02-A3a]|uniref:response regulator n=1 Tax=Streptacidiphilus sp. P02-A3a TaxID=2704468 RepID=UPI0015FB6981|nr:response regulator [Streptacidiphilus sp. P02-A3a]QMU69464.1 response regulator [Streptacidiphilus sp. P02-A3a]